jgi:hypothetical protein
MFATIIMAALVLTLMYAAVLAASDDHRRWRK